MISTNYAMDLIIELIDATADRIGNPTPAVMEIQTEAVKASFVALTGRAPTADELREMLNH